MPTDFPKRIRKAGVSIYDSLKQLPGLFIDHETLEKILNAKLVGLNLAYPLRTRSKVLKARVCDALGYPVPPVFKRTQPRFLGQNFDTYVQKSNNLQIWNEDVAESRRYVLVRLNADSVVSRVRVVTGEVIARLDTTGTLTRKYQARVRGAVSASHLVVRWDTDNVARNLLRKADPRWPGFMPIASVFDRLTGLIGTTVPDAGHDQERNRGGALHNAVSTCLGLGRWHDSGQFPDVVEQLVEVKLQTAPTIDLGLVCPDAVEQIADYPAFSHCDVRFCVFYGIRTAHGIRLKHVIVTTGEAFFKFFVRFEGKVRNSKRQLPLPPDFFA